MQPCHLVAPLPHTALPRRPLTIGELLDAAAQLVRGRARVLLLVAAGLAVAEQGILFPIREALGVSFRDGFKDGFWETVGALWVMMAIGLATEAFIILILGVWTGRAAATDLVGSGPSQQPKWAALIVAAPVSALFAGLGGLLGPLWVFGYGLFGLAGAAIGLERRGPFSALGRAAAVAFRNGMRATWVRVLGYFAWLVLRLGFVIGAFALLEYVPLDGFWVVTAGLVVANTVAYVFLAALDAATLAESRFRSEGLDIWLSRAERHGALTPQALA